MKYIVKKKEIKKIPKLRFLEFSGEWKEKVFGEVFDRVTRKNKENNKNVLTISAQQGLVNQEDYFNKSVSAKDVTGYYLLHKNDFAYNKSYSKGYPMGAIKRLKKYDKGVVSTLYICFKSRKGNPEEFLEQYFESGKQNREIQKIAQEGARNHGLLNISVDDFFDDIKLFVPREDEQQKIAEFLGSVDEWIGNLEKQKEEGEKYKKGMMQKIFSQEIQFKDENGEDFSEWEEVQLGEYIKKIGDGGTPPRSHPEYYYGNINWIVISDICKKISSTKERISPKGLQKSSTKLWPVGAIIVSTGATIGEIGILQKEGCTKQGITGIVLNDRGYNWFFYYLFQFNKNIFLRYAQGGTFKEIRPEKIKKLKFTIPTISEQQKIADFLNSIDDVIESKTNQITKAKQWKKGLMQKMFV